MPGPAPQMSHQRDRDTRRRQAGAVTVHNDGEKIAVSDAPTALAAVPDLPAPVSLADRRTRRD